MAEYKECEAIKRSIVECCGDFTDNDAEYIVSRVPTADVAEVKWISVNEGLPEEDTRVLVYLDRNANPYTFFDTDRLKNGKWVRWNKRVTHWMPLPEPPKGGEDNG